MTLTERLDRIERCLPFGVKPEAEADIRWVIAVARLAGRMRDYYPCAECSYVQNVLYAHHPDCPAVEYDRIAREVEDED